MFPSLTHVIRRTGWATCIGSLIFFASGMAQAEAGAAFRDGRAVFAPIVIGADGYRSRAGTLRRVTPDGARAIRREARREFRREARREYRREVRRDIYRDRAVGRGTTVYVPSPKYRDVTPRYARVPRYAIGGYLPRRGFVRVVSPHRLGLATARPGYAWYAGSGDAYLIALGTGLIVKALTY
ncbi:MAG: hypothetical protein AAFR17_19170 [Pseudomonadota bacterium]